MGLPLNSAQKLLGAEYGCLLWSQGHVDSTLLGHCFIAVILAAGSFWGTIQGANCHFQGPL